MRTGIFYEYNIYMDIICMFKRIADICNNCIDIKRCNQIKYLGVVVDEKISWTNLINYFKELYQRTSILRQFCLLRYLCPLSALKTVYYGLVNPQLQYGMTLWGSTY